MSVWRDKEGGGVDNGNEGSIDKDLLVQYKYLSPQGGRASSQEGHQRGEEG